jgi:aromatic ring-cleaving dioxygenase
MIENQGYHAHIYYNAETRPIAERLRKTIAAKFAVRVGELSDEPRGPHPISQFAAIMEASEFRAVADAEPRRPRRAGASADGELL